VAETAVAPTDPRIIRNLNVLADLYLAERRHADAEPLLQRSLAIQEATLGAQDPKISFPVVALVEIFDRVLGPEDLHTAFALEGLAGLYAEEGKYAEAEPLYGRALPIFERLFDGDRVASLLEGYARVLASMERHDEAEALRTRARAIHERAEARRPQA
jgi:tetratricopeptide (TPR) repeat protein